jgi:signal transduction histidine kinase
VPRSSTSLLFGSILVLSFALVVWWTTFQVQASHELAAAGAQLSAGDVDGAAQALGAPNAAALADLASRRRTMFASEGAFFAIVLLGLGWLYVALVRRERRLRAGQDRFLAAATHELKTPLATITLLLESLRSARVPTEKRARYLGNGLLEAERLGRGLDNVLTAAGLRTAPRRTRPQPGDLAADVAEAIAALEPRAQAADIAIAVDAPTSLPCVRDGAAIQLVLRNLLDNAVKYSAPGNTVRIQLATDGERARIEVHDQGRGMDPDELAHAFDAFWRGSDTASGGTGLGLHLVRELVLAHSGSVHAASAGRDRGSVFTVLLPLRSAA